MNDPIAVSPTGIDEIDRQHAQLLTCLNELLEFAGGSYEFAAVFTAINTLLDYAQQHFADEEKLLASWHYPKLEHHIAEHREIEAKVRALWARVESDQEVFAEQIALTIRQWIVEHINAEDIEYAKYREIANASRGADAS